MRELESTIYCTGGEHANHYTTNAVVQKMYIHKLQYVCVYVHVCVCVFYFDGSATESCVYVHVCLTLMVLQVNHQSLVWIQSLPLLFFLSLQPLTS